VCIGVNGWVTCSACVGVSVLTKAAGFSLRQVHGAVQLLKPKQIKSSKFYRRGGTVSYHPPDQRVCFRCIKTFPHNSTVTIKLTPGVRTHTQRDRERERDTGSLTHPRRQWKTKEGNLPFARETTWKFSTITAFRASTSPTGPLHCARVPPMPPQPPQPPKQPLGLKKTPKDTDTDTDTDTEPSSQDSQADQGKGKEKVKEKEKGKEKAKKAKKKEKQVKEKEERELPSLDVRTVVRVSFTHPLLNPDLKHDDPISLITWRSLFSVCFTLCLCLCLCACVKLRPYTFFSLPLSFSVCVFLCVCRPTIKPTPPEGEWVLTSGKEKVHSHIERE